MKNLEKNEKTAIFVSFAIILFFFVTASVIGFVSKEKIIEKEKSNRNEASLKELTVEDEKEIKKTSKTIDNMKIIDTLVGKGEEATAGKTITVHYTGTLEDGAKFDSSLDRGQPFKFILGAGQVIQGWEKGFDGMKVGGKRSLIIPAELAYGDQGVGDLISPGATLLFDVELLMVEE